MMHLFLYGPPGSGKSTLGRILATRLERPFIDLDLIIEATARQSIPDLFASEGETGFRIREQKALKDISADLTPSIISLGGGALLNPENRALAQAAGDILFLEADAATLEQRCARRPGSRPLLSDCADPASIRNAKPVAQLVEERGPHYRSFPKRIVISNASPEKLADAAQRELGLYHVSGMGRPYDVCVGRDLIGKLGTFFESFAFGRKTLVVGDTHTVPLYGDRVVAALRQAGIEATCVAIPAGEATKTITTVSRIWSAFAEADLERKNAVIALGGGVVGDLVGFASATWKRGVSWINLPTTLLAMVDSGLGGKTGADLPEGKNLIGAFHPPSLVLADTTTLASLPVHELRCGLAEAIKHAIIGDPELMEALRLFSCCATADGASPCPATADPERLIPLVSRALAVKVDVVCRDPYEKSIRATLNLGHTIGHALEQVMDFKIRHGEAIAIGTVLEARLAEKIGLAQPGLGDHVADLFRGVGLPVTLPGGTPLSALQTAMHHDKKNVDGKICFALPAAMGDVRIRQVVEDRFVSEFFQTL